jgi:hypothetical protein
MAVHYDSGLGAVIVPLFVIAGTAVTLIVAAVELAQKNYRFTGRVLGVCIAWVAAYLIVLVSVSLLSPQTTVKVGDSYCADIWCIGIDHVNTTRRGQEIVYTLDAHIFSDANTVNTSAKKEISLYLVDDRGRRFPLVSDPSAIPFDVTLNPHQKINTALTFVTTPDVRQLFLAIDATMATNRFPWLKLYFGSDFSLLHKPPRLRVL